MEVNSINDLYKRCSEKYSLAKKEFCSLEDFHQTFQVNDRKMMINLLNLTYAEGNKIRSKELWEAIHKLDDKEFRDDEFMKDLSEFSLLGFLLLIYPYFYFQKSEKPDFILRNADKLIGLEVISAISNLEAQVSKVAKYNFGRNKSTEEIQEYINENHQNIADKYGLYDVNGRAVLSPFKGLVDCHAYKDLILEKALNKAKKIKSYAPFSEMWVLIDTEDSVCFTEEHDAEELSKLFLREDADLVGINKIIVINIINKAFMFYDVKSHEFNFVKHENTFE